MQLIYRATNLLGNTFKMQQIKRQQIKDNKKYRK